MPKATSIVVTFDMERETKNTIRFMERGDPKEAIMGKVYVQKTDLEKIGSPKSIQITVTAVK